MRPANVQVALGDRAYEVRVGAGTLEELADVAKLVPEARKAVVVTQPSVARYAAAALGHLEDAGLEAATIEVADGEVAKGTATLQRIWHELAQLPLGRDDLVVAVGGGVVGDLAGFAAATWNRGVAIVQVPTTLLAQVDAAIGGKTAINLPEGKNLVGAFHQPAIVLCDVATLATLPPRHLVAGFAEVVKCGLIREPGILLLLETAAQRALAAEPEILVELVRRSASVKAVFVSSDERETGMRAFLNLGHTLGHAIEAVTGYDTWLHGEAVAVGLVAALRLGVRIGRTPEELVERTESLLGELGLPTRIPPLDRDALWAAMARDKKARGDVRFVVLDALAFPALVTPDRDDIDAAIDAVTEES